MKRTARVNTEPARRKWTDAERVARWRERGKIEGRAHGVRAARKAKSIGCRIGKRFQTFRDAQKANAMAPPPEHYYSEHTKHLMMDMGCALSSSWPRKVFKVFRLQMAEIARGERKEIAPKLLEQMREMASGVMKDPNDNDVLVDVRTQAFVGDLLRAVMTPEQRAAIPSQRKRLSVRR